jgi:HlyD family secretion protein
MRLSTCLLILSTAATASAQDPEQGPPRPAENFYVGRPFPEGPRPADGVTISCMLANPTTILTLKPEGTVVKKGEPICELDASTLRDQLVNQQIAVNTAYEALLDGKGDREAAEIGVREFQDGLAKLESDGAHGDVRAAEADLAVAREALAEFKADKASKPSEIHRAEVAIDRAEIALGQAKLKLKVLTDYTHPRKLRELTTAVDKARAAEKVKGFAWELAKAKTTTVENQVARSKIVAPISGRLVYANPPAGARTYPGMPMIEEGATVRQGQRLFRIVATPADPPKRP